MTPDQVKLVQQSFGAVAPIADTAAALFYERLFETAPAVKPLFHGDMAEQRRKLMATLATVVGGLGNSTASSPSTTNRSAPRCCGPSSAASASAGAATSPPPGRPPSERSPNS